MMQYTNRFAAVADEKGTEVMITFMQSSPSLNVDNPSEPGELETVKVAELAMTFEAAKALEGLLHDLLSETENRRDGDGGSDPE